MTRIPASPSVQDAEVARVRNRLERLLLAGISIASEHVLDTVLQRVVDVSRDVVGARYAALGVLAPDGQSLARFVTSGLSEAERERIGPPPAGRGILGVVIREAKPLRLARICDDPRSAGYPPHHPRMNSFLGVPIRSSRGGVYGNLYLTEKIGAQEFSQEDEHIAVLLAAQAAAAIENARLHEEQSELLQRLQTLQRQRDQFFAMINHELRNALTGVYGWAEQLVRARSVATMERAGQEVYESAERTITLMNNLLDLSRLDAGRVQVVIRPVQLSDLIRRCFASVRPAAAAKGIRLRDDYLNAPASIDTDQLRLEQVLLNLLTNAVRHSPPEEEVLVRIEGTSDQVLFSVIDRGPGIAQDDQTKIFEPYIRVDPESGLGSGLGLPVARRMAELIGGRLSVSSDLGRGATFTISLPRVED